MSASSPPVTSKKNMPSAPPAIGVRPTAGTGASWASLSPGRRRHGRGTDPGDRRRADADAGDRPHDRDVHVGRRHPAPAPPIRRRGEKAGGPPEYEIVGVVENVRFSGRTQAAFPATYFPHAQQPVREMPLLLNTSVPPLQLAALGVYGVMNFAVAQRTRELGIRLALGARSWDVRAMVLWRGVILILAGLAAGLAGATATSRVLQKMLFEVTPADPLTLATVVAFLGSAGLLACWLPAHRATRLDPMVSLRAD